VRAFLSAVLVFFAISGSGVWVSAQDTTPPTVLSTIPANGAVNVSVNLAAVSLTFSEPMQGSHSIMVDFDIWVPPPGWEGGTWSPDMRTLTISRNPSIALPVGVTIQFTLDLLRDVAGNPLGTYTFFFLVGTGVDNPPSVTSTNPANGATGVSRDLPSVSITFSEPMNPMALNVSSNFPSFSASYSDYNRVLTFTRNDLQTRLAPATVYTIIVNPQGGTPMTDTQGNPLPTTTFSFTTAEEYDFHFLKVSANPAKGFHWPYYLCVPFGLSPRTVLLVEPNNTGTTSDDLNFHDTAARNILVWRSTFAIAHDLPLLVPTFPRPANPGWVYTHALDRYSLTTTAFVGGYSIERIDLQLIAMINDAREKLTAMGHAVDKRVFMHGFSASGAFTSRFSLLHPEVIKAAAPGSPGGWPIAPVPSWNIPSYGTTLLRYPVGIADAQALSGKPVNTETHRGLPLYIYVGDVDQNDALDLREFPSNEYNAICSLLTCGNAWIADRWPIAEQMYDSVNAEAQFAVYPRVAHTITEQMFTDVGDFFNQHRYPIVPRSLEGHADYNGDGKSDLAIYRGAWGAWYIQPSGGGTVLATGWGGDPSDIPVLGDFDGDGRADIAIYRQANGAWWIIPSSTGTPYGVGFGGGPTDIPVPGDYDGDGKTDLAIYRQAWGAWFIQPSGGGAVMATGWGGDPSDIPVPADYDGDGKTDLAVYRQNNGAWWIKPSSTGVSYGLGFGGGTTDIPIPGDYDGDGKADIGIYRKSGGAWYIQPSARGSVIAQGWGGDPSDIPVPGDYDGDGKTDIAVYRQSNGAWWIIPSTIGTPYGVGFGGEATDIPIAPNLASVLY
jgi:hypothetical protein